MGTHRHGDTLGCACGLGAIVVPRLFHHRPGPHGSTVHPPLPVLRLCTSASPTHVPAGTPLSAIQFLAFIPQKHGGGLARMQPTVWPCPGHSLSVPIPILLSHCKRGGGGQQLEVMLPCPSCHLPSHPSLSLLDFDSVTIPELKQPLCKVRHHTSRWRFLLRGSLVIGVSLYRYKTSRGRAPARTPLTLRCCTAIPVPSPPVPALGPGEVTAHSVLGVPSQPWGDTGSKEPQ